MSSFINLVICQSPLCQSVVKRKEIDLAEQYTNEASNAALPVTLAYNIKCLHFFNNLYMPFYDESIFCSSFSECRKKDI